MRAYAKSSQKGADDRGVIKEILFSCDRDGTQSAHYRRRMSLLLLLHAIGETAKIGADFDRQTFSDLTYYGRVVTDEEALKKRGHLHTCSFARCC